VQELRRHSLGSTDLVQALTALGDEITSSYATNEDSKDAVEYRVLLEGSSRSLHPLLRDDLYRILREAVGNAFHHARAKRIEVEIRYDVKMLRVRVRDDGIGMDTQVLAEGKRGGHWGLPGMRERATSIGAQLNVWSEIGAGTEIEVKVPGVIAYANAAAALGFPGWLERKIHKL